MEASVRKDIKKHSTEKSIFTTQQKQLEIKKRFFCLNNQL